MFEAGIIYENLYARADILVPIGKNEWDVKKIIINEDGVSIKHKHNLFYKHWFIYH